MNILNVIQKDVPKNRIIYFDLLKIIAICFVILMHSSVDNYYAGSLDLLSYTLYHSICLWTVPMFVIISGALFLNKEISIKKLYSKYILRILTALIFWSGIYYLTSFFEYTNFIGASFHLWYLYMIISLYVITPLIKEIVKKETLLNYFLIIGLIINFLFACNGHIYFEDNSYYGIFRGYVFYFILGYYINNKDFSKRSRNFIYILGLLSFILNFAFLMYMSHKLITPQREIFNYFNIFVIFEGIFIFTFAKNICSKIKFSETVKKIIYNLSKYVFGAYCVHKMIINNISYDMNVMLKSIIVIILSFGISAILNNIPIIKKYIV